MKLKTLITSLLAFTLILSLAACQTSGGASSQPDSSVDAQSTETPEVEDATGDNLPNEAPEEVLEGELTTIKLGVVGENNEQWEPVREALLERGIVLEYVKFADYALPNTALADGEIEMNSFQHYAFLNKEIEDKGYELTVIGDSIIAPLGLFSSKIESIEELKEGDKIAIPNDATNGGRALKVLEAAGVISVDPEAGYTPEIKDITNNALNLEFVEVEAAQTPGLLPDVAAAIINGHHAADAGLNPENDSIYLETVQEGSDNPYINVIVVRTEDKDNELYLEIVDLFQSDEVAQVLADTYEGIFLPAWK